MSLKDIFKKLIDGYDDTVPMDDFDDDEPVYMPKNAENQANAAHAPVRPTPVRRQAAPAPATNESPDFVKPQPVATAAPKKSNFKRLIATRLKSAEQAITLAKEGYVVVVDTTALSDEVLANLQYYLAGAVFALGAHIYPVQEGIFLFSIEEFDINALTPRD